MWAVYRPIFRNRNLLLLMAGQVTSQIGNFIGYIAIMATLYQLTGSSLIVGTYLATQAVTSLVVGPVAGILVDRAPKRSIMIWSDLIRMAIVLLLPFATNVTQVLLIAVGKAAVAAFFVPAKTALIPSILEKEELSAGLSADQTISSFVQILGPALAGAIVGLLGVKPAFFLDAGTYLISILSLALMVLPAVALGERKAKGAQAGRGFWALLGEYRVVLQNRVYARLTLVKTLSQVGATAVNVVLLAYALDVLGLDNFGYGLIGTSLGAGILLGSTLNAPLARRIRPFTIMGLGAILIGGFLVAAAGVSHAWLAYLCMLGTGLGLGVYNVSFAVVFQTCVPAEQLGRAAAGGQVIDNLIGLVALGSGGLLADLFGVRPVLAGSSVLIVLSGLVGLMLARTAPATPGVESTPAPTETAAAGSQEPTQHPRIVRVGGKVHDQSGRAATAANAEDRGQNSIVIGYDGGD